MKMNVGRLDVRVWFIVCICLWACACATQYPLSCNYEPDEAQSELQSHQNCAARQNGTLRLAPHHLQRMSFSSDDLAQALIDGQWHYIKRNGDTLPVITYDNGADYFSEGLVRSIRNGKIAYYTLGFAQAVPPRYDWGWPFENSRALVCRGCKNDKTDELGHIAVEGGEWGYIDRHGIEVVPVRLSRAEALSK